MLPHLQTGGNEYAAEAEKKLTERAEAEAKAMLADSRKYQSLVSTKLAEQVIGAVPSEAPSLTMLQILARV